MTGPCSARALGLPRGGAPGDRARFTADRDRAAVEAIVYLAKRNVIGVRAPGALYRFLRGFGHADGRRSPPVREDTDPAEAARAWESWLTRTLEPAS